MDLALYSRVLRRHKVVIVLGLALAVLLGLFSYYRVDSDGTVPRLVPRKAELWQSQGNVFLTESGFPAGRRTIPLVTRQIGRETVTVPKYNEPGRYTALAALYARLATSDEVQRRIQQKGPPYGAFLAFPAVDTTGGNTNPLPMISVFGQADSAGAAQLTVSRGLEAFFSYVAEQQNEASIPKSQRVQLTLLNAPKPAFLLDPRKKTLPIVVFLGVLMAAITLAFILENAAQSRAAAEAVREAPVEVVAAAELEPHRERRPELEPKPEPVPVPEPALVAEPEPESEPEPAVRVRRWA